LSGPILVETFVFDKVANKYNPMGKAGTKHNLHNYMHFYNFLMFLDCARQSSIKAFTPIRPSFYTSKHPSAHPKNQRLGHSTNFTQLF
jgi:hypothetical protein